MMHASPEQAAAARLAAVAGISQCEAERTLAEAAKQFSATVAKVCNHCIDTEHRCSMHGDEERRFLLTDNAARR